MSVVPGAFTGRASSEPEHRPGSRWTAEAPAILARYPDPRSALVPLLQKAQDEHGFITGADVEDAARLLDVTPAFVESVISFYTLLRRRPTGRYLIQLCRNLSCSMQGAEDLVDHLSRRLGVQPGETTADGMFTLETVECLAACDGAPCLQVNLEYHLRQTPEQVDALLADLRVREEASGRG